jgi:hypothetical protein
MPVFCQTVLLAQCVIQRLFQRSFVKRSGIPNIIGGARQQCFTWVVGLVVNKTGGAVARSAGFGSYKCGGGSRCITFVPITIATMRNLLRRSFCAEKLGTKKPPP